ncbi:MAG: stage 0 sporulation protein [Deltaproteobacteria bacterium]|nr:stage 0 sporulation protein [Deltaproteobacteria bacterium]
MGVRQPVRPGPRPLRDASSLLGGQRILPKRPPVSREPDLPCRRTVNVRLRVGGQIQAFECGDLELDLGDWVLVMVDDLVRMGVVATRPVILPDDPGGDRVFLPPNRRLLRAADLDDLARQAENELEEREAFEFCAGAARRLGLVMKLVWVEKTFDGFKTIFYYTADDRVDFRQLVKDLVRRLRTRVEMRQISVRTEALMLGGNGLCGRPLCCASFLKDFYPVSVRMAKEQNLAINTLKISGVCGRLMCCLAFESEACGRCPRGRGDGPAVRGGEEGQADPGPSLAAASPSGAGGPAGGQADSPPGANGPAAGEGGSAAAAPGPAGGPADSPQGTPGPAAGEDGSPGGQPGPDGDAAGRAGRD